MYKVLIVEDDAARSTADVGTVIDIDLVQRKLEIE